MTRARFIALAIIFALFSAASAIGIYYTHQLPTEETKTTTLLSYEHAGKYDYIAQLTPNNLYNQTTLKPGEGTLYTRIVYQLDLNFSYAFRCGLPADMNITYVIEEALEAPGWKKPLKATPPSTINSTGILGELTTSYHINVTAIQELIRSIEQETGTSASACNLTITPQIHTIASTKLGTINESFTPTLAIRLRYRTEAGDQLSLEGLEQTSPGAIQKTEKIPLPFTMNQRYAAYAISIPAFTGLAYTVWAFFKATIKPPKPLKEIIKPYEEIIAEAREPSYEARRATITMSSLEDLVKVADSLGKPLLHSQKELTHTFYVLDGLTKYEYTITAQIVEKKPKPKTPTESD